MIDLADLAGLAGAPVVVALVEVGKQAFPGISARYYAALTLGVAIGLNELVSLTLGTDWRPALLVGLVTGLAASGLYSQVKAVTK